MRRAQYLAIGGSAAGAAEILNTALGYPQDNELFWEAALLFLANHEAEMRPGNVRQIVNYLSERTRRNPFGGPEQDEFTLRGRSLRTLLRDAVEYERTRPELERAVIWWQRLAIEEWRPDAEEDGTRWTIVELLNDAELRAEGDTMRHCVAGYAGRCRMGLKSIWSVRSRSADSACWFPVMTVEIDSASRTIVQARGKCNQSAMAQDVGPLLREAARQAVLWAERENLTIAWGLLGWHRAYLLERQWNMCAS
jgi:hypothetical protein